MFKRKRDYLIPVFGFLLIILIGSIILYMPFCTKYTALGQVIIAILMNIGAVGFISLIVVIFKIKNRRISLSNMKVINDSISDNNYLNLREEVVNILKYVFSIELIGAILLAVKFIPEFGFAKGVGYSLFHSISAFSNTGFDLFGEDGLIRI